MFIHELSHISETAKGYDKLKKTVLNSKLLDKWLTEQGFEGDGLEGRIESYVNKKKGHYAQNGEKLTDEGAEAELIANFLGETIGTEERFNTFMNELTSEQKRTFLEWLKDIWDKIFGKNKAPAELRHIEKLFGKALTEAKDRLVKQGERPVETAIEDATFSSESSGQFFISEEKSVDKNELDRYNKRGWADNLLSVEDHSLLKQKIEEAFVGKQHHRLKDGTKVIEVNNKILFVSGTFKSPVIDFVVAFNSENSTINELNKAIIIGEEEYGNYTKQDLEMWEQVSRELYSEGLFAAYNRKDHTSRSVEDLKTRRRATLPESFKSFGYSGRFTIRDGVYVKDESGVSDGAQRPNSVTEEQFSIPEKSSDGQKLTDEQSRFFRNSKVRDEKGRLLAVYHGTKRAGFTTFTKTDDIGYFFARSMSTSRTYANKSKAIYAPDRYNAKAPSSDANYKVFLNITNPYVVDGKGAQWNDVTNAGDKVLMDFKIKDWDSNTYTGKGWAKLKYKGKVYRQYFTNPDQLDRFIKQHLNEKVANSIAYALNCKVEEDGKGNAQLTGTLPWDFLRSQEAKTKSTRDIVREASAGRYDGVVFKNVVDSGDGSKIKADDLYVAFYPNQIKSVNNLDPTYDNDIRYDIPENGTASTTERDNRTALATALEGIATNAAEREIVVNYKNNIAVLNKYEADLKKLKAERKKLSFAKGPRNTARLAELDGEIKKLSGRITRLDKKLVDLEVASPIKSLIEREKGKAKKSTAKKYQEARKKGVESRQKTKLRIHISKKFNELNSWLLNPTKEKHVPESLRAPVAELLKIVNLGDVERYEKAIERLESKKAMEADYDTLYYYLGKQTLKKEKVESLKHALQDMRDAYTKIGKEEGEHPFFFDQNVAEAIEELLTGDNSIQNTPLHELNKDQLEQLDKAISMLHHTVTNANKMFNENIKRTRAEVGEKVVGELTKSYHSWAEKLLNKMIAPMLKPVTFFDNLGSNMFNLLFKAVEKADGRKALLVEEAKKFALKQAEKYNVKKWDTESRKTYIGANGAKFSLSLGEAMTIYGYSKRPQAKQHLVVGGFEHSKNALKNYRKWMKGEDKNVSEALKHLVPDNELKTITEEMVAAISDTLTDEQKAFVDEMMRYMSEDLAKLGNEITMARYNIKGFKDPNYIPIVTSQNFLNFSPDKTADPQILNMGFTKEVNPNATNPLVLYDFMELWGKHVDNMTTYVAYALPVEDLQKAFNYNGVKEAMKGWGGDNVASAYIKQLLLGLNHATRGDPTASRFAKGLTNFKFASTALSLSVVVQQPTSLPRAMAYIEPKYFGRRNKAMTEREIKKTTERMIKYSGIAALKEQGGFDTDLGPGTPEYITGKKKLLDKTKDWIGGIPAWADRVTWAAIWRAAENKVLSESGLRDNTPQYWARVTEVFEDCIKHTQVYDSTLSRSQMMRSRDFFMKMITSFMSEPTVVVNMTYDAVLSAKRGNKKKAAAMVGSIVASSVINSVLVSLVKAMRDDDEDESAIEKYLEALFSETIESANPFTYFPIARDIWSAFQGYDVERTDLALISDIIQAGNKLASAEEPDLDDYLTFWTRVGNLVLPTYNAYRDTKAVINSIKTWKNHGIEITPTGAKTALRNAVRQNLPKPLADKLPNDSRADMLYDSYMSGDMTYHNRLKKGYESEEKYRKAMVEGLRNNDPRIAEAALADVSRDVDRRVEIAKDIASEGVFTQKEVVDTIFTEANYIENQIEKVLEYKRDGNNEKRDKLLSELRIDYGDEIINDLLNIVEISEEEPVEKPDSYYKSSDLNDALESGDAEAFQNAKDGMLQYYYDKGKTKREAESELKQSISSYWKDKYIDAYIAGDSAEMQRIQSILKGTGYFPNPKATVRGWYADYQAKQREEARKKAQK